ncbi:glycosyltransferase family 2 protein [Acinetobacter sp. YH12071]|uniref:glycosyltransferase family 2 protein n=1 Tax=Acinetobacter TaxID=469 RepID=UPI0015D0F8D5|nr:glycosyltransferase family 2 protein [Acinetobacter sp. YH12071]
MTYPLVSIMMPAYNAEATIENAILSLLMQTYKNWECIIVNDGSVDKTLDILKKFNDDRLKIFSFDTNKGRGVARQFAIQQCKGEFLAMLDADDWYYYDKLEKQVKFFLNNPDVDLVSCGMVIQKNNQCIGIRGIGDNRILFFNRPTKVPVPHASSMFRRNIVGSHSYDSEFKLGQDMDFLRHIMLGKKYAKLDFPGYVYDEYISNNYKKISQSYQFSAKSYLKFIGKYPVTSIMNFSLEYLKFLRLILIVKIYGFDKVLSTRSLPISKELSLEFNKNFEMLRSKA